MRDRNMICKAMAAGCETAADLAKYIRGMR